jgi:hypothetical protein
MPDASWQTVVKEDMRRAGGTINRDKNDDMLKLERRHLGFDADLANELLKTPVARWDAL